MVWQQLQIKATALNAETISDLLMALGSPAVTLLDAKNQPLLEPAPGEMPMWNEAWVSALFDETTHLDDIINKLKLLLNVTSLESRIIPLQDKNWSREWLEHFHPMQFGTNLWVTPEERRNEIKDKNAAIVILDPGLAFGTGTHPTTALCLSWLDKNINKGDTVIDYGCGSGILALAAAKLGADKVYCIDNDPQALIATRENAKRNQLSETKIITQNPEQVEKCEADILVANILSNPLIELAPLFFKLVKESGQIALSGILKEQVETVKTVYQRSFHLYPPQIQGDWALLSGQKAVEPAKY